jgi:hypothetical protein
MKDSNIPSLEPPCADELDYTMLKQAIRASNLAILMESPKFPPLLDKLSPLFTQKKKNYNHFLAR